MSESKNDSLLQKAETERAEYAEHNGQAHDIISLRQRLQSTNPADIAEDFENLDDEQLVTQFRMLSKNTAADVFANLSGSTQESIVNAIQDYEISHIVDDLFLDDAVDFIEEMPANVVKRVLRNLPKNKRNMINHFLQYPDGSAGSIMTIEFVDLKEFLTVEETFQRIRRIAVDRETIYTCYVIDSQRRLLGVVSAKTLLLAEPEDKIGDIMDRDVIYATTCEDVENLANDFRKYGLLAMPIVDNEHRLVGIVTVDDVLEIQEEEATEDFEIMAAISPSDDPYLKTSVWVLTKNRLPWLMLLMLTATITGTIIEGFQDALASVTVLMSFIPMLMDTGGNCGAQSSTLVIRNMALGEVESGDIFRVWWKEIRIAVLCGGALAVVNCIRILILHGNIVIALSVSLSLYCTVLIAKSMGCMLPQIAKRLKFDPAVMASPMITTLVDACSLLIFFTIAKITLNI
ncbi:MAG: magnesium transporter [Oscillospiraceae bacterium]|nr:magnesium transporter [Oscillospiraceae bacterium]